MGPETLSAPRLADTEEDALTIPRQGLQEVLSAWSGRGDLLATVAASLDDDMSERSWSNLDVRRRAHRVLLQALTPALTQWPRHAYSWLDVLPAETVHRRHQSPAVVSGVDWVSTRIESGWPPATFEVRGRERTPHTLLLTTLRWTLERLSEVKEDALHVEASVVSAVMPQLDIALTLLEDEPLSSAMPDPPTFEDLRAVAREGRPWNLIAAVATELVLVATSPEVWALRLLEPDPELRPTLFHLGVLGALLQAAVAVGGSIVSRAPLTGVSKRPNYVILDAAGNPWDVWFEAGGLWSRYGRSSPYVETTAELAESSMPLKPDLVMVRPDEAALVLECKYSRRIGTVGRAGVTQTMAYGLELHSRVAPRIEAYVVAPEGVVESPTQVATDMGKLGLITPPHLEQILDSFWSDV